MSDAIARIDAARLRNIGSMLVDQRAGIGHEDEPENELLDLRGQSAAQMLADYNKQQEGFTTAPFDPYGDRLRFYEGGISIWSGYPGSGKTTILRQFACHLQSMGHGVFFASLEEHPRNLAIGIAAVANRVPLREIPTEAQLQAALDKYHGTLKLWGKIGIARHKQILAVIRRLADEGIKHAIIDSLMCLDIRSDDYEAQRAFAVLLSTTARAYGVHIHIVAHPRKPMQGNQEPDLGDVAGAKEIGGVADNVIFIRRGTTEQPTTLVPMKIIVKKQRHWTGEWPTYEGFFNQLHRQYVAYQWSDPIKYV